VLLVQDPLIDSCLDLRPGIISHGLLARATFTLLPPLAFTLTFRLEAVPLLLDRFLLVAVFRLYSTFVAIIDHPILIGSCAK
jgi:hypothetical protein